MTPPVDPTALTAEKRKLLVMELREAASQCVFENQCERYPGVVSALLTRAADAIGIAETPIDHDALGLSLDMLDADRLREWAVEALPEL